jgi:hypothetical protein
VYIVYLWYVCISLVSFIQSANYEKRYVLNRVNRLAGYSMDKDVPFTARLSIEFAYGTPRTCFGINYINLQSGI